MDIKDIPEELIKQILSERGRQNALKGSETLEYKEKKSRAGKLGMLKRWGKKDEGPEIKVVLK